VSEPRARPKRERRPAAGAERGPRGAEARARVEPEAAARPADGGAPGFPAFDGQYRIQLAQFEGPLDLLLHLIQQHELDILDIPVSFVTTKYLEYLSLMTSLAIDVASEYLVMAATLAHIKSRMLLPAPPPGQDDAMPGEEDLDPREELVRRLLEYQKYKAAAAELSSRESMVGRDVFLRGMPEPVPEGLAPFAETSVFSLFDAFEKVLKRANIKIEHEVVFDRISITDRMMQLTERLTIRKAMRFEELFEIPVSRPEPGAAPATTTRFDLVITFLALLEMCRLKVARVYQSDPLAPIHVELAVKPEDVDAAVGLEDATPEPAPAPAAPPPDVEAADAAHDELEDAMRAADAILDGSRDDDGAAGGIPVDETPRAGVESDPAATAVDGSGADDEADERPPAGPGESDGE
jgi:segregation and condensation protein A